MNSKVFGTINANTWAKGDELGNQFNVLNTISNPSSYVDICNVCKRPGDIQMSPDSLIYVNEGGEESKSTTGSGVVDITEVAKDKSALVNDTKQQEETDNDYVESSPIVGAVAGGATNAKYISENNTVAPSDLTDSISDSTVAEQQAEQDNEQVETPTETEQSQPETEQSEPETPATETNEPEQQESEPVAVIGKDEGAVEKFCTGQMSALEYSINITIIILFIAISIMAIMLIFKMAYCKCLGCGSKCSHICPKCGKCDDCCVCHQTNQTNQANQLNQPLVLNGGYFSRKAEAIAPEPVEVSLTGSIF